MGVFFTLNSDSLRFNSMISTCTLAWLILVLFILYAIDSHKSTQKLIPQMVAKRGFDYNWRVINKLTTHNLNLQFKFTSYQQKVFYLCLEVFFRENLQVTNLTQQNFNQWIPFCKHVLRTLPYETLTSSMSLGSFNINVLSVGIAAYVIMTWWKGCLRRWRHTTICTPRTGVTCLLARVSAAPSLHYQ